MPSASALEHECGGTLSIRNRLSCGLYDKFYQNVFPSAVPETGATVNLSAYNNATDRNNLFNQTDVVWRARTGGMAHTVLAGAESGRQATDNFRNTGYFGAAGSMTFTVPLAAPTVSAPVTFRQSATDADNHGIATITAIYAQDQVELTSWLQAVAGLRFDAFGIDFTNHRTRIALQAKDRLLSCASA